MGTKSRDFSKRVSATIDGVDKIHSNLLDLFGEESNEDGLISIRSVVLHQFAILASSYHQMSSIEFLENSKIMSDLFNTEISTAHVRTRDYEHKAIRAVQKNLEQLEKYQDEITELEETIEQLLNECHLFLQDVQTSYYSNLIKSLVFYLEEILSRVVQPALTIISAEINASDKMLDVIGNRSKKGQADISPEEIARMCEVMSWGLEVPPGWKSIQSDTSEISNNLEKKLGSLRAFVTYNY